MSDAEKRRLLLLFVVFSKVGDALPIVLILSATSLRIDLCNAYFTAANLPNAQMEYPNFTDAQLLGATIQNAIAECAMFRNTHLKDAKILNTKLHSSALHFCSLYDVSFNKSDLSKVWFYHCKFDNTQFRSADLRNASISACDSTMNGLRFTADNFDNAAVNGFRINIIAKDGRNVRYPISLASIFSKAIIVSEDDAVFPTINGTYVRVGSILEESEWKRRAADLP